MQAIFVPFLSFFITPLQDATLELKVKTVKYFKGLMRVHQELGVDLSSTANPTQQAKA
jgi:hypothetical protein